MAWIIRFVNWLDNGKKPSSSREKTVRGLAEAIIKALDRYDYEEARKCAQAIIAKTKLW